MKKKLIQFLMLLVVAVSVGSFVSCKDTNEDLYNELRTQYIKDNASLREAFEAQVAELEGQIATYKAALEALQLEFSGFKSCECEEDALKALINGITEQIDGINDEIATLTAGLEKAATQDEVNAINVTIAALKQQVDDMNVVLTALVGQFNPLATEFSAYKTAQDILKQTVDDLEDELSQAKADLAKIKTCECDFTDILTRLTNLEARMFTAETDVKRAYELATSAVTTANDAKDIANGANTTANEAKLTAQQAKDAADAATTAATNATDAAQQAVLAASLAEQAAQAAGLTADEAKQFAQQAQENVNTALQTANLANAAAAAANTLAQTALDKANKNAENIATNTANIASLQENARIIESLVSQHTQDIAKNAQDITALDGKVQKNIADIAKNAQDIAANTLKIEKNAQDIAKNAQDISNINTQLTSMTQDIADALARANDAYAKAETNYELIAGINETIAGLKGTYDEKFSTLESATSSLTENLQTLTQIVGGNTSKIEGLTSSVNDLTSTVDKLSYKLDSLGNVVSKLQSELSEVKGQCAANLEAAKLYAQEQVAALHNTIIQEVTELLKNYALKSDVPEINLTELATKEDLRNAYDALRDMITDLGGTIPDVSGFVTREQVQDAIDAACGALEAKVYAEISKDRERISANETAIWYINEALRYLSAKFDGYVPRTELENWLNPWLDRIAALEGDVDDMEDDIKAELVVWLNTKLGNMKNEINNELDDKIAQVLDEKNYLTEDDVEPIVNAIVAGAGVDDIKTLVELVTTVDALRTSTVKIDDYTADMDEVNRKLDEYKDKIGENEQHISDLKNVLQDVIDKIEPMQQDIESLKSRMDEAEGRLDDVEAAIDELNEDVAAIQDALAKQVTQIIIQGTYNPMFGSFSIPANIQSNMLLAYYGVPIDDVEFPTDNPTFYVRQSEALTAKDMEMINGVETFTARVNQPLMNENYTAGKIYMTINPNTVDFTKLQPTIVNTLDEESLIKLSPIQRCNEKLQFGYTRADNGFYVAEATVAPRTVMTEDNGLALTRDDITALYHSVQNQIVGLANNFNTPGKQTDLADLATSIYQVIRNMKVDRNGLKVTYTTKDASGAEKEHAVYSEYNLAATFLKPLNLAWLGDQQSYVTMPGYEVFDNLLNRFASTLKNHVDVIINDAINIGSLQNLIRNVQIDELTYIGEAGNLISNFEARVSHITLNGVDYRIMVPGAGGFDVKFDKNLKANGAPMSIPAAVAYDENRVTLERAAVVISGDIVNGMDVTIVVPAKGVEDGVVAAYATLRLVNGATATATPDAILLTVGSDTYNIAAVSGTTLDTTGCTPRVVLSYVVGSDGSLNLPVAIEISENLRSLLARQGQTINNVVTELNNILNRINNYNGIINGWIDQGIDEFLRKYLDQINADVVYFFNSINRRFGPFMVASNEGKGFKRLSGSKEYPTALKANGLKFYPTTKTLELIVPIARKHVAVTNVFKGTASAQDGNSECKTALNAANTGKLNTVIDGTLRWLEVTGLKKGFVYEVAYSVLDFDGNISTQKYYVTVE